MVMIVAVVAAAMIRMMLIFLPEIRLATAKWSTSDPRQGSILFKQNAPLVGTPRASRVVATLWEQRLL